MNAYAGWILNNPYNAGECLMATLDMLFAFPELKRIKGTVITEDGKTHTHWWCEDPMENIWDPTSHQFDGEVIYTPHPMPEL